MGWLGSSADSRSVGRADGRTGYEESKSLAGRSSWSVEPVRHPFQLTTTTSNTHAAHSASVGSNAPLHPQSSHLDMLPTPTAVSPPPTILQPERAPSARSATIPSRLTFRTRPTHPWIVRNRYLPLFLSIPLPLLLSVLYCIIGHAVLRAAQHTAYEQAALSSSAIAGAVGGAILTLPILALLFAIQRLTLDPADAISEDFFDDDESDAETHFFPRRRRLLLYFFVVIIAVFVGAVAGPIGFSVLKNSSSSLGASHGAVAGVVGGSIVSPLLILSLLVL
ncbi:hypothetical protein D9757_003146 [Collybiopsis confluens]|uniref:Uncharacterized protein n=1 Tax=Collybiopsis confluens TaxID=2823264 RepID=A0A8H5HXE4_9AGAR|nr:hypothetical protein D9757_003146 [Collybiopsis confluens]